MIQVKNLTLKIGSSLILDEVSFFIQSGEYVGLIGPNGAGKSSLLKILTGEYQPTSGSVSLSPECRIGYVPQGHVLSSVLPISVTEVLKMSGVMSQKRLTSCLEQVGLDADILKSNFHQLSGGQKQRVIIARTLCTNPNVLLFDEPFTGIDVQTKLQIYDLLAELNEAHGLTILFVSHEVDQIIEKCHRILCLDKHMHDGCHPLDFAHGKNRAGGESDCPVVTPGKNVVPIHHHHNTSSCSC